MTRPARGPRRGARLERCVEMSEIFISWSKERSLALAKALRVLMTQVLSDSAHAGSRLGGRQPRGHAVQDCPRAAAGSRTSRACSRTRAPG